MCVLLVVRISTYAIFHFFFFFDREASARQEKENIGTSDEERRSTFSFLCKTWQNTKKTLWLYGGAVLLVIDYTPTGGGETSVRVRERERERERESIKVSSSSEFVKIDS
jgi:hypothetical protein